MTQCVCVRECVCVWLSSSHIECHHITDRVLWVTHRGFPMTRRRFLMAYRALLMIQSALLVTYPHVTKRALSV